MSTLTQSRKDIALWQVCLALALCAAAIVLPDVTYATDTPIGNIFCILTTWMTGNTGKGIATIAITVIGIGALLGKVSWGMAMIVCLGIALVFGASGILDALGISGMEQSCNTNAGWGSR